LNLLTDGVPSDLQTFAWFIGCMCGAVLDLAMVVSIALTPRLREHSEVTRPRGLIERWVPRLPAFIILSIWFTGLLHVGVHSLLPYAVYSAASATIVSGIILLLLVATAGNHIARRSVR
jgi:hypothetical protein